MEVIKEAAPFIVGLFVPPVLMLAFTRKLSSLVKFGATVFAALILGVLTSLIAGELFGDIPEAFMSIVIDTSLVFTASQVAYKFFWKPVLAPVLGRMGAARSNQRPS